MQISPRTRTENLDRGMNNIIGHGSLDYSRNYYYSEYENVPTNVLNASYVYDRGKYVVRRRIFYQILIP